MNKINFYLESRLAAVKKRAAEIAKHNPEGAYRWALDSQVKYKRPGYSRNDTPNHYSAAGDLHAENLDGFDAVAIQDISRRAFNYSGYFADSFQCELIKPYIVKIKTARGLFIAPTVAYSESDCATVYFSQGGYVDKTQDFDSEYQLWAHTCAGRADRIAERLAEHSREDDAKFQAEDQAEQLAEDIKDARQTARGLIVAIKAQRKAGIDLSGAICDALTDKLREYRRQILKARERREALKENYWLAVEGY